MLFWRPVVLWYADGCMLTYAHVCSRMLTYAHVCSRMLTYAHVCSRMLTLQAVAVAAEGQRGGIRQHTSAYVASLMQAGVISWAHLGDFTRARTLLSQVSIRQRSTCIRQHTSAYVSVRAPYCLRFPSIRQRTSAYVSVRQRTSAHVSIRSAYVQHTFSIRQHTFNIRSVMRSAYVSIRRHTSAYASAASVWY
jgi:hypothetical protein